MERKIANLKEVVRIHLQAQESEKTDAAGKRMLTILCIYLVICILQPCVTQETLEKLVQCLGKKDEFSFCHIKFEVPEDKNK